MVGSSPGVGVGYGVSVGVGDGVGVTGGVPVGETVGVGVGSAFALELWFIAAPINPEIASIQAMNRSMLRRFMMSSP